MASGKTEVLFSGYKTTNSFEYRKFTTLGFAKTSVVFEVLGLGSGIQYTIRGYPVANMTPCSLASGEITTSSIVLVTSGLDIAMEEMDVGVKSLQDNYSGIITVYVARKRR